MSVFSYTGTNRDASPARGTIAADTPRQARDRLRERGVRVRRVQPCRDAATGSRWRLPSPSRRGDWATAVHELAMMLHAGIPLLEAVETLTRQARGSFRSALLGVQDRIEAGSSLAAALAERPDLFDPASVHMVEVGENAGKLEDVLRQLADFKRKQLSLRDNVTTALIYPIFLVGFGVAAAIFLMTSVLPPLLDSLRETVETLPWPTRVAKAISDLLVTHGSWLTLGCLALFAIVWAVSRTVAGQRFWHRTLLHLPVIGPMAVKQSISRIAMIVATLIRSGVELTRAFELAETSTKNVVFRDALGQCGRRIAAGEGVAEALERSGAFPPLAVRVFSVGQESGQLDDMLLRLAEDYEQQVAVRSTRLTALLEPTLILILAAGVGFLLLATILPILEAGNVAN